MIDPHTIANQKHKIMCFLCNRRMNGYGLRNSAFKIFPRDISLHEEIGSSRNDEIITLQSNMLFVR